MVGVRVFWLLVVGLFDSMVWCCVYLWLLLLLAVLLCVMACAVVRVCWFLVFSALVWI